jgi:chromate transporter
MPQKPSFKEAFYFWLKLGFISFGGPAGQIAIMHQFLVEKKKWISESRFLHALNYCMLLPGPEAQQMATYMGWLMHGIRGGLIAGILFVLPSVFILLLLSILYVTFGSLPAVYALFDGLKPAIIAIIIVALIRIGSKSLVSFLHYVMATLSFVAIFFFNFPFPLIILFAILFSIVLQKYFPSYLIREKTESTQPLSEVGYYINSDTYIPETKKNKMRILRLIAVFSILWSTPLLFFYFFINDNSFWISLSIFFSKAAMVTFGGAYAVLPYVAQVSVEKFHWLNEFQMIDGLALGETTPGPLIMVLAFVGFMGAYNHYNFSILHGAAGLFTTVWFTFLPCFLFIFIGAPFIERTRENLRIKNFLSFVSSAIVGVIFSLTIYLTKALFFISGSGMDKDTWFNVFWILISLLALYKFRINMVLWILISALTGLGYYLAFS